MIKRFIRTTQSKWDKLISKQLYNNSIVFIEDTKKLWSNGVYYNALQDVIPIAHSDLQLLQNNNSLVPGQQYRITDYVTTTHPDDPDVISAEHQFDIIVIADSDSVLNKDARIVAHTLSSDNIDDYYNNFDLSSIRIQYDLNYVTGAENCKGAILLWEDTWGNKFDYDITNIKYRIKVDEINNNELFYSDLFTEVPTEDTWWFTGSSVEGDNLYLNGRIKNCNIINSKVINISGKLNECYFYDSTVRARSGIVEKINVYSSSVYLSGSCEVVNINNSSNIYLCTSYYVNINHSMDLNLKYAFYSSLDTCASINSGLDADSSEDSGLYKSNLTRCTDLIINTSSYNNITSSEQLQIDHCYNNQFTECYGQDDNWTIFDYCENNNFYKIRFSNISRFYNNIVQEVENLSCNYDLGTGYAELIKTGINECTLKYIKNSQLSYLQHSNLNYILNSNVEKFICGCYLNLNNISNCTIDGLYNDINSVNDSYLRLHHSKISNSTNLYIGMEYAYYKQQYLDITGSSNIYLENIKNVTIKSDCSNITLKNCLSPIQIESYSSYIIKDGNYDFQATVYIGYNCGDIYLDTDTPHNYTGVMKVNSGVSSRTLEPLMEAPETIWAKKSNGETVRYCEADLIEDQN